MKVTLEDIYQARKNIQNIILKTDLSFSRSCSDWVGTQTFIKYENLQLTGSFKIRGALNKMLSLKGQQITTIAASAGNHAQGVAFGARFVGIPAKIVMPLQTPIVKKLATLSYGAEVILHGEVFDDSFKYAKELEKEKGYVFVHPFEDEKVIAGQGTIGLEILEQLPDIDSVIVAIGGGGMMSGIATVIKSLRPQCKVYGVVSNGFNGMQSLLRRIETVNYNPLGTIADGIAVKKPSQVMFDSFISKYVDDIAAVEDDDVAKAIVFLLERTKSVAEGSAAITLAAAAMAKNFGWDLGKKTVVVLGGGNIDMNLIERVIERGLSAGGRIARFKIVAPDRPGQLQKITQVFAQKGANILEVFNDRVGKEVKFRETIIRVVVEAKGLDHVQEIKNSLDSVFLKVELD
jgi:threonine dehydratase